MDFIVSLFRNKKFLNKAAVVRIQEGVALAEKNTSGEIRIFIEKKCTLTNPLDRAKEMFFKHKMFSTQQRNGILLYIAYESKKVAIYGDEGIHQKVGQEYWHYMIQKLLLCFSKNQIEEGILMTINEIGEKLKIYFPYDEKTDTNELSNDILFQ